MNSFEDLDTAAALSGGTSANLKPGGHLAMGTSVLWEVTRYCKRRELTSCRFRAKDAPARCNTYLPWTRNRFFFRYWSLVQHGDRSNMWRGHGAMSPPHTGAIYRRFRTPHTYGALCHICAERTSLRTRRGTVPQDLRTSAGNCFESSTRRWLSSLARNFVEIGATVCKVCEEKLTTHRDKSSSPLYPGYSDFEFLIASSRPEKGAKG
jgi:hypothetical protein